MDGCFLLVSIDEDGSPPATIGRSWLWIEYGGELLDADVDGVYELEAIASDGPPWAYVWTSPSTTSGQFL